MPIPTPDKQRARVPPPRPHKERTRTLTASEAAALVGVSVATIRGWADAGVIPSHRTIGGHRRFEVRELTAWLEARGAPAAGRLRPRTGVVAQTLPPCPRLARALNAQTEAVLAAVEGSYHPDVPLAVNRSTEPALRRAALRFLRITTNALDSGNLSSSLGRSHLVGVRAGLQGDEGIGVVVEFGRFVAAVVSEAHAVHGEMQDSEPLALPTLMAVLDAMHAALVNGYVGRNPDAPSEGLDDEQ